MSCTKDIPPPSERNDFLRFSRKALAATATLGTGNSLGPEGPSVEAGMSISRLLMNNSFFSQLTMLFGTLDDNEMSEVDRVNRKLSRDRLLLACGAASGGAFDFNSPLMELPLYLVLGVMSGVTAATFSGVAQFLKNLFDGKEGPPVVRDTFLSIPKYAKPLIGSIICGIVAIYVPEVLFFGYETLNGLFLISGGYIPTGYLFIMLVAKLLTTASSASSGLVGGTFAPSLFLGGVLGAGFHNVITDSLQSMTLAYPQLSAYPIFQGVSGLPAFAMVGAASVLAALFRAPLTASLLLFECTGNYDVILPLMASAGVASLTGDVVEKWLDEEQRESDNVSWGALALRTYEENDDEICLTPEERSIK